MIRSIFSPQPGRHTYSPRRRG